MEKGIKNRKKRNRQRCKKKKLPNALGCCAEDESLEFRAGVVSTPHLLKGDKKKNGKGKSRRTKSGQGKRKKVGKVKKKKNIGKKAK